MSFLSRLISESPPRSVMAGLGTFQHHFCDVFHSSFQGRELKGLEGSKVMVSITQKQKNKDKWTFLVFLFVPMWFLFLE